MMRYSLSSILTSEPEVLPEQDLVAGLHVEGDLLAVVADLPRADGDDLALLRLLLGRVRDDDPASLDLLLFQTLDHDSIVQRTHLHLPAPSTWSNENRASTCRR